MSRRQTLMCSGLLRHGSYSVFGSPIASLFLTAKEACARVGSRVAYGRARRAARCSVFSRVLLADSPNMWTQQGAIAALERGCKTIALLMLFLAAFECRWRVRECAEKHAVLPSTQGACLRLRLTLKCLHIVFMSRKVFAQGTRSTCGGSSNRRASWPCFVSEAPRCSAFKTWP